MSVISKRTVADRGPDVRGAGVSRQDEAHWPVDRSAISGRRSPRRGKVHRRVRGSSGPVARHAHPRSVFIVTQPAHNVLEIPAVLPAPRFCSVEISALYDHSQSVCYDSWPERAVYALIAASALLAVGGGLSWVVQLITHWSAFSSGIEKLLQ